MIEPGHPEVSVRRQCELLGVSRSGWYYTPEEEGAANQALMRRIDEGYTRWPFYGVRRMAAWLAREGATVNVKRVRRLMRAMGLEAIYAKPRLSAGGEAHRRYAYLLQDLVIDRADQVWCADITYLRLRRGFLYLVAVMDWFSRYVVSWAVSASLETEFCLRAMEAALGRSRPEIFNSDQGVQFTSAAFTGLLEGQAVRISMDGRGRCFDNIFVERLWRTVKYEEVYLRDYADAAEAAERLGSYFRFYNVERLHQSLGYRTPAEVYFGGGGGGSRKEGAAPRPAAGPPVALRAPSVPAAGRR